MNEKDNKAIIRLVGRLEIELRGELIKLDRKIAKLQKEIWNIKNENKTKNKRSK